MLIRWGLWTIREVLAELGVGRPLLITTARWAEIDLPIGRRFAGALPHADLAGVRAAAAAAAGADGLVALGGGSTIDTAKAVSTQLGLPLISVPTTYAGAEWTAFFANRDAGARSKPAGTGAKVEAIIYEPELTRGLPPLESCGTGLNALAHCAEALYARGRSEASDRAALTGAALIARWLPAVIEDGSNDAARRGMMEGAMHAGAALRAGMGLGHGMAQVLGARYGLPHGPMNAVSLPHALRFNREVAAEALARLAAAMEVDDPAGWIERQGAKGCPMRLRDYGLPREDFADLAAAIAARPATQANPRPVSPADITAILVAAW